MTGNFYQDWPIYIFVGAFIIFLIYAAVNNKQQERKNKESQNKEKTEENKE